MKLINNDALQSGSILIDIGSEKTSFNPQYVFTDFHDEESGELSGETYENDKSFYISLPKIKDDDDDFGFKSEIKKTDYL